MNINFYNNLSKKNVVNKSLSEILLTLSIIIKKDNFNISSPTLFITTDSDIDLDSIGNYCYIPDVNRYYFIDSVEMVNNIIMKLQLDTDYLKTFKTDILQGSGLVKASKNVNNFSSDYDVLDTVQEKTIIFPNTCFSSENKLYLTGAN